MSVALHGRQQTAIGRRPEQRNPPRFPKRNPAKTSAVRQPIPKQRSGVSVLRDAADLEGSTMFHDISTSSEPLPVPVLPSAVGGDASPERQSMKSLPALQPAALKGNVVIPNNAVRRNTRSRATSATSVIDEKYRESLQRHYRLLMTKMTLDDDVIKKMGEEKILPETMIKDILEAETREEKNQCLLRYLHLRGNRSYRRFRELMFRTGHYFIADLLWDEGEAFETLLEQDLVKIPGLMVGVPEKHRKRFLHFLEAKVRERALVLAWKTSPEERMQVLNNKVVGFYQEREFRETIQSQEIKIQNLENSLLKESQACRDLKTEMSSCHQQIQQMKKEQAMAMETQTRFHDANLNTIVRLKDRLNKCKGAVTELNDAVKRKLELGGYECDGGVCVYDDLEDDLNIGILERNIWKLLSELKQERGKACQGDDQRQEVLKLLNRRYTKEPLVTVVKDVLKNEQKHRAVVMRDILRLAQSMKNLGRQGTIASGVMESGSTAGEDERPYSASGMTKISLPDPSFLETKQFKAQLALLIAEAEHIQKRFQWKDSEIAELQKEVQYLRHCLRALPYQGPTPTATTGEQGSPKGSSSEQSLQQPFSSPTDTSLFNQEEYDYRGEEASSTYVTSDRLAVSRGSQRSNLSSLATSMSQKTSTPGGSWNRTAQQSLRSVRSHRRTPSGSSQRTMVSMPDLDKTLVNVDQYLLEEEEDGRTEEEEEEDGPKRAQPSPRVAPSRGEGDINSSHHRSGRTPGAAAGLSARSKKRGMRK